MKKSLVSILIAMLMTGISGNVWAGSVVAADLNCTNPAGCVQTNEISDGAVTGPKLATGAVTNGKIAAGAVTDVNISGTISASKLGSHTHNGSDIADGTITNSKIGDGAVTDAKIAGTISGAKLGTHVHSGSDITDTTITTSKIADGAITGNKLADWSVSGSKIVDFSITDTKISSNAVSSEKIADGAITDAKISGIIGTDKLSTYSQVFVVHKGVPNNQTTFNSVRSVFEYLFSLAQQGSNWPGERHAILVMPGRYDEDLSILNDWTCSGQRGCSAPYVNVDIIGASRAGSIIIPVNNPYGTTQSIQVRSGMYLRNLSIEGGINYSHAQNAGVIDCDVLSQGHAFFGGWENIKNFTVDDVSIETPAAYPAIDLWGTGENDTLVFNNIRIKKGSISIIYPISTKAYTFRNITFSGTVGGAPAFYTLYANINAGSATFNLENITIGGDYGHVFNIDSSNEVKVNITNSKLMVSQGLLTANSTGNNEVAIDSSIVSAVSSPGSRVKIGNSKIGTIQPSNGAVKVVSSHDENYDPIQNGSY